jgi:hypothetical protein
MVPWIKGATSEVENLIEAARDSAVAEWGLGFKMLSGPMREAVLVRHAVKLLTRACTDEKTSAYDRELVAATLPLLLCEIEHRCLSGLGLI